MRQCMEKGEKDHAGVGRVYSIEDCLCVCFFTLFPLCRSIGGDLV
jgi:hypothetical protein